MNNSLQGTLRLVDGTQLYIDNVRLINWLADFHLDTGQDIINFFCEIRVHRYNSPYAEYYKEFGGSIGYDLYRPFYAGWYFPEELQCYLRNFARPDNVDDKKTYIKLSVCKRNKR